MNSTTSEQWIAKPIHDPPDGNIRPHEGDLGPDGYLNEYGCVSTDRPNFVDVDLERPATTVTPDDIRAEFRRTERGQEHT